MKHVYIVQSKEKMLIHGVFKTKQQAEKYTNNSDSFAIIKTEVI